MDQDLFSTLFGIDHETLVKGGQEIVEGGGRLGNVLFAASSGISNLRALQQKLEAEIGELFKAGGRNQRIPRAIAEFREAQKLIKELQLPSERGPGTSRHCARPRLPRPGSTRSGGRRSVNPTG